MSAGFAECSGCGRHVRASDSICPFCRTAVTAAALAIADTPGPRLSRAAILAGAALMVGCQTTRPEPVMTIYGGPPEPTVSVPEAGADDAAVEAGVDAGADAAAAPSVDSTRPDAGKSPAQRHHDPSPVTIYGAPPREHSHGN